MSIATSITQYRYENGRRYHIYRTFRISQTIADLTELTISGEGEYWAPNDEQSAALDDIM